MSHLPCQDQFVRVTALHAWTFATEPVEVLTIQSDERLPPQSTLEHDARQNDSREPAPSRPTLAEMMASFRALREQRGSLNEHEIVLDQIVRDGAADSLASDIQSASID